MHLNKIAPVLVVRKKERKRGRKTQEGVCLV
jgi:hypothetical protein